MNLVTAPRFGRRFNIEFEYARDGKPFPGATLGPCPVEEDDDTVCGGCRTEALRYALAVGSFNLGLNQPVLDGQREGDLFVVTGGDPDTIAEGPLRVTYDVRTDEILTPQDALKPVFEAMV